MLSHIKVASGYIVSVREEESLCLDYKRADSPLKDLKIWQETAIPVRPQN